MAGWKMAVAAGVLVLAAAGGPAWADEPVKIVEGLYAPYMSDNTVPKSPLDLPVYSSDLRHLIDAAPQSSEDGYGLIDFDILVNAQDYGLTGFQAREVARDDDSAEVRAAFLNLGTPTTVTFHFVKEAGDWRIADIAWPESGGTLSAILKTAP